MNLKHLASALWTSAIWISAPLVAQITINVPPPEPAPDDTRNDALHIRSAFLSVAPTLPSPPPSSVTVPITQTVKFEPGTYNIDLGLIGDRQLEMNTWWVPARNRFNNNAPRRLKNIRIVGASAPGRTVLNFIGYNPDTYRDTGDMAWACGFHLASIDGLTIEDIDIRVSTPLATEGRLTSANEDTGTLRLAVTDPVMAKRISSLGPLTWSCRALFPVFASGQYARQTLKDCIIYNPELPASIGDLISELRVVQLASAASPAAIMEVDLNLAHPWLGNEARAAVRTLSVAASQGADIALCLAHQYTNVWKSQGLRIQDCTDVRVSNCSIRSVGWGVETMSCKNVMFENIVMGPTNPGWMIGMPRGCFGGVYGSQGHLHFRNCNMTSGFDDYIEVTGSQWSRVTGSRTIPPDVWLGTTAYFISQQQTAYDRGIAPGSWGAGSLLAGSEIEFFSDDLSASLGRRTIRRIDSTHPYGIIAPVTWSLSNPASAQTQWEIAMDRPVPTGVVSGSAALLRGNIFESAIIEDCTFIGGKGCGVMAAGSNITVRRCVFQNLDSSAIRAHCIFDRYQLADGLNVVGPPVQNLLIEDNTITGCNRRTQTQVFPWPGWAHWGYAIGAIDVSTMYTRYPSQSPGSPPPTPPTPPVVARTPGPIARGIHIRGNTIVDTGRAGISVASAMMTTIVGNTVRDTGMDWRGGLPFLPAGTVLSTAEITGGRCALVRLEYCDTVAVHGNNGTNHPPGSQQLDPGPGVTSLFASNNTW